MDASNTDVKAMIFEANYCDFAVMEDLLQESRELDISLLLIKELAFEHSIAQRLLPCDVPKQNQLRRLTVAMCQVSQPYSRTETAIDLYLVGILIGLLSLNLLSVAIPAVALTSEISECRVNDNRVL
ncbi:hypothetical protein DPMN_104124 [Dreissena polymorpha]|uniref:Uncharacterized protein n=1 Tax=Dreissena polymorpha TaxID=45954 RepID=A0A9D4K2W8_DREPO|nr:hypothetical protein DPMN_104124 [Dreissena polymorpha]